MKVCSRKGNEIEMEKFAIIGFYFHYIVSATSSAIPIFYNQELLIHFKHIYNTEKELQNFLLSFKSDFILNSVNKKEQIKSPLPYPLYKTHIFKKYLLMYS